MSEELLPPIHPGEILREEFMVPLGLTSNALAKHLGVTAARINEIAKEHRGITADTALRLARYFKTTPEFWMNLQKHYELETAQRSVGEQIIRQVPTIAA
jgi:addiction module HigA family antidote